MLQKGSQAKDVPHEEVIGKYGESYKMLLLHAMEYEQANEGSKVVVLSRGDLSMHNRCDRILDFGALYEDFL